MKSINFTEQMFRAVIDGRKTQTRRIMKPQIGDCKKSCSGRGSCNFKFVDNGLLEGCDCYDVHKPRYKVGETVYLKEPYCVISERLNSLIYKFDNKPIFDDVKWKNKLFMPEKYARYFIEITAVRCERLQDISGEDCIREGIFKTHYTDGKGWVHYDHRKRAVPTSSWCQTPKKAFECLIYEIYGFEVWEANPFVWVYEFELIKN